MFSILSCSSQASRLPHAVGAPRGVFEAISNVVARYASVNLIVANSEFRFSAGARLCRITRPRKSSGRCDGAGIRHDPGFGIAPQFVGRQVLDADLVRVTQHDLPNRRRAERGARHLVVLAHRPKYLPLRDLRRDGSKIEPVFHPARNRYQADLLTLAEE